MEHPHRTEIKKLIKEVNEITTGNPIIVRQPLAFDIYKQLTYPADCTTDAQREELVVKRIAATIKSYNIIKTINELEAALVRISKEKAENAKGTSSYHNLYQEYLKDDKIGGVTHVDNVKTLKDLELERAELEKMLRNKRFI